MKRKTAIYLFSRTSTQFVKSARSCHWLYNVNVSFSLSLSLPGQGDYMCPVFSVCIITDYMWLHNTHTHMCICLILKWFLRHAVKVSIFQLFVLWPTLIQIITEHLITLIICLRFIRSIWARECVVALIPHHMQNQQYVTRGRYQVKGCLSSGASVCVGMHASISMAILYKDIDNCILWEYVC